MISAPCLKQRCEQCFHKLCPSSLLCMISANIKSLLAAVGSAVTRDGASFRGVSMRTKSGIAVCRTRVLQRLGHLGKDSVVTIKARPRLKVLKQAI